MLALGGVDGVTFGDSGSAVIGGFDGVIGGFAGVIGEFTWIIGAPHVNFPWYVACRNVAIHINYVCRFNKYFLRKKKPVRLSGRVSIY